MVHRHQREDPIEDEPAPVAQSGGQPIPPTPRRQHTQLNIAPPNYIPSEPPLPQGEPCEPSRLYLHQFGSRFLPHANGRIHCMLPLLSDRFLLVGSADGLSVVDVLPSLHPRKGEQAPSLNPGLATQPLADAVAVPIWTGEAVYQLDLLEDATSDMNPESPQGVVLALVGPSDDECGKSIRMYNLASLASLVRWYCNQGVCRIRSISSWIRLNLPLFSVGPPSARYGEAWRPISRHTGSSTTSEIASPIRHCQRHQGTNCGRS